ncbi:diguanylate cyclase [Salinisphaera sp. SPP-AMP-43]|uniref:GGDEF domain-containing protein n=1 Tax=Salinisphaera sp. SPP-AMP-43 TaxID=3121288 RepID=UPI003C6E7A61
MTIVPASLYPFAQSGCRRRQILLTHYLALFGACATVPYQLFYLLSEPLYYAPILGFNIAAMAGYIAALYCNIKARTELASRLVLIVSVCHIIGVNLLIGASAGVYLFFFSVSIVVPFLRPAASLGSLVVFEIFIGALLLACHLLCRGSGVISPVPSPFVEWIFAGSTVGALGITLIIATLFRNDIVTAETRLMSANDELYKLSATDELTKTLNRRGLEDYLGRLRSSHARPRPRLGVAMCDVDYFKSFNDHFGHAAGDTVLAQVADTLKASIRNPGDCIARYGGEEFVIVMPGATPDTLMQAAERARQAIESLAIPHPCQERPRVLTISAGVAVVELDGPASLGLLLRDADKALYRAKHEGRNRCVAWARQTAA